ncbi:hypothetical protein PSTG_20196, partial [Puccinia striiformis f. sp. tritici PST-78]
MSVDSDNPNVDEESFGTNTQPNDDQTRMVSMIPGLDSYGNDDDEEEEEETKPSTPANTPSIEWLPCRHPGLRQHRLSLHGDN